MATMHILKLSKKYQEDVERGLKRFELRKNDRDYQVGDLIQFEIVNDLGEKVDKIKTLFRINYILKNVPQYGLSENYAILQIEKYKQKQESK